jgi:hypothetical protein
MSKAKAPPPPENSESFENFERFAKQLLQVPKKELDDKLAAYEREKERKKNAKKHP